jgi:hypothetical protein
MPDTIWDGDAISILWNDCRRKAPECTAKTILEQVSNKLNMKSWARIQNPVGFLLISVPPAVQAAISASKWREQTQVEGEIASANREAQRQLHHEQELAAWTRAEQAFEALPVDRKQDLVNKELQHFLREHPEYRNRTHLPGWKQSFRSKAIRAFAADSRPPPNFILRAHTSPDPATARVERSAGSTPDRKAVKMQSLSPPGQNWFEAGVVHNNSRRSALLLTVHAATFSSRYS